MKTYLRLLLAELLVIPVVVMIFKFVEPKIVAGAIAGTVFVLMGAAIFFLGLRRVIARSSPTFIMGCIHLFGVALPMMITRLLNQSSTFSEVKIWGLPGPAFHSLSTGVYFVMMGATVFDLIRTWRSKKLATAK